MDKVERKSFSKEERIKILKKTDNKCAHCGKKLDHNTMTIEHIFPIYKGGTHDEFNLVALCYECNQEKANMLYHVADYYKYILPEYMETYISKNAELMSSYDMTSKRVFRFDSKMYKFLPDKHKLILYNMVKRKTNKNKVDKVLKNLYVNAIMERAYEGDAKEIYEFVNYLKKHDEITLGANLDICDNEMKILNMIRYGDAYVLRVGGNICGAFLFKTVQDELNIAQLDNIIEVASIQPRFILVFGYVNMLVQEVYNDIMEDIFMSMIAEKTVPLYFNMLDKMYLNKKGFIKIPYKLEGVDGTIEFFTLKEIEKTLKECLTAGLNYKEVDSTTQDKIVEAALYGTDDDLAKLDLGYLKSALGAKTEQDSKKENKE